MDTILEHKTFDIFLKKRGVTKDYFEEHINDTKFCCLIKHPVFFAVERIKIKNDTFLNVYIDWYINWYSPHEKDPTAFEKRFPNTWEGYVSACKWLDTKRVKYIKALV
jgi:hypothetical protein